MGETAGRTDGVDVVVARLRTAGCVFAEDEARLLRDAARTPADLAEMLERRIAGQPLETILGWVEFCGLRIVVEPGVFVPRRRTQFLARQAAALTPVVVLDLCCGSGAVGAALARVLDDLELYAVDLDSVAVQCARRNIPAEVGRVYQGDLYAPVPVTVRGRIDVVVANAPYVPTESIAMMAPEARLHEPRVSLDGGADGLDIARRIVAQTPRWLAPGGHLMIETSAGQAGQLRKAFADSGFRARTLRSPSLGATLVIGTMP